MEIDCKLCINKNHKNECLDEILYVDGKRVGYVPCKNINYCYYKQLQQLKSENEKLREELKSVENDRKWIKEKCIDAGKELGKYSFAWDGKEKNLVVQAMQLNEMYEKLKAENEELKDSLGLANKYVNKYKTILDEIEGIVSKGVKIHDDIIVNKQILQLIKQAKEDK